MKTKKTNPVRLFFDLISDIKFDTHMPLFAAACFMVYAIYRTNDYLSQVLGMGDWMGLIGAIAIELIIVAGGALTIFASLSIFIYKEKIRYIWLIIGILILLLGSIALILVSWSDALLRSNNSLLAAFIMGLIQTTQILLILAFVYAEIIKGRDKIRDAIEKETKRQEKQSLNKRTCPYCGKEMSATNLKRHTLKCDKRKEQT